MTSGLTAAVEVARGGFRLAAEVAAAPGRVTALVGPSGAGKSTLVRVLAGLEAAATGRIVLGGRVWQDSAAGLFVPAHRRAVGVVFQEAHLFPHRTVRGNLEFGWRRRAPERRAVGWDEIVERLHLGALLARPVAGLSGGERQRVALARALLASPEALLLDEPLAGVDPARRGEVLPMLQGILRRLAIPVLYVTHTRGEVVRIADRVVALAAGRVAGEGSVADMAARLDLLPAEPGEDVAAVVETVLAGHDDEAGLSRLEFPGGVFLVPRAEPPVGERLRVRILARDVSLTLDPPIRTSILNRFPGTVRRVADDGEGQALVELEAVGQRLFARLTRHSVHELALAPGVAVTCQVKAVALS